MNKLQLINNFKTLNEFVIENLEFLRKRIKRTKKVAFYYRLLLVIIAASVTLVLGINISQYDSKIALVLSSMLTVLTTLDHFEKFTTKYIGLNKRITELVKLGVDLNFYMTNNEQPTEEKFTEFKDIYFSIINDAAEELSARESVIVDGVKALSGK